MKIHFVGDVHADAAALSILDQPNTIQLGDMNLFGYDNWLARRGKVYGAEWIQHEFKNRVLFVEGNHENFPKLNPDANAPYEVAPNLIHIPRGYASGKTLFVGGGDSIDKAYRTEGIDWFPEEKINSKQVDKILAIEREIEVVVSHDCPHFALADVELPIGGKKKCLSVGMVLEDIFMKFRPKMWIFGHYHISHDEVARGCRFRCLNVYEEQIIDIPVDEDLFGGAK